MLQSLMVARCHVHHLFDRVCMALKEDIVTIDAEQAQETARTMETLKRGYGCGVRFFFRHGEVAVYIICILYFKWH